MLCSQLFNWQTRVVAQYGNPAQWNSLPKPCALVATWDTRAKLDAVKKMLSTTTRSIRNVSLACGYPNTTYLKVLFKRRFGMTMVTFRKSGMV